MLSIEQRLAQAIIGQEKASVLMVDAYKLSMAQAGFPLREETFVNVCRRGPPLYNPFNLDAVVQAFRPSLPTIKESAFLTANGYGLTPAMEMALARPIRVVAAPKGTWVAPNTPTHTVTSASFLASWQEHFNIMLNYPLQIATAMKKGERHFTVVCPDEATIVNIVAEALELTDVRVTTDHNYKDRVRVNIQATKDALGGETERGFEVGLRAATCMQQHLMVLDVARSLGFLKTSNVYGAWKFYMIPVGTTGHEHQKRWGGQTSDDRQGFRAIRDMRPEPPSYLFDTTDPLNRGIPAAIEVMQEDPNREGSMRFDSGDQDAQFLKIRHLTHAWTEQGLPCLIFEDSYTADKTARNEAFCEMHLWPRRKRQYGYGGFWVSKPHLSPYNRDVVSASYKLSCTAGQPVMKAAPGKESIPGKPIVLQMTEPGVSTVMYIIAQEGEDMGDWKVPGPLSHIPKGISVFKSTQTSWLIDRIKDNLTQEQ